MILKDAYLWIVKERLNLTIEGALLEAIKVYAAGKRMSVSQLVEDYFRSVTRPIVRKNIVEMVDELVKPVLDGKASLKELFYQQQEGKHGL